MKIICSFRPISPEQKLKQQTSVLKNSFFESHFDANNKNRNTNKNESAHKSVLFLIKTILSANLKFFNCASISNIMQ